MRLIAEVGTVADIIDYDALERATAGSASRKRKAAKALKGMAEVLEGDAAELDGAGSSAGKQRPPVGTGRRPVRSRQPREEPRGDGRDAQGRRLSGVDADDDAASKGRGAGGRDAFGRRIQ